MEQPVKKKPAHTILSIGIIVLSLTIYGLIKSNEKPKVTYPIYTPPEYSPEVRKLMRAVEQTKEFERQDSLNKSKIK